MGDPRPFTLRKLQWMAAGRYDCELRSVSTAVAMMFAEDGEDLISNPYRPNQAVKKPSRSQSDSAFDMFGRILSDLV